MADFSVVIPVRDDLRVVRCLESFDTDVAEPLVVMNDPTPAVERAVRAAGVPSIRLARPGGPLACEEGMRNARHEHVLFMDSDCVFRAGTLKRFHEAIGSAPLVRGRVVFAHYSPVQRVVADVRSIHTNAQAIIAKVPLLLDRSVARAIGGHVLDRRLTWTEDFDLTLRVNRAGLRVRRMDEAIVVHDALSFRDDLRSAYAYGRGHRLGVALGLPGYGELRPPSLRRHLSLARRLGLARSSYAWAFNTSTTAGYMWQRLTERKHDG